MRFVVHGPRAGGIHEYDRGRGLPLHLGKPCFPIDRRRIIVWLIESIEVSLQRGLGRREFVSVPPAQKVNDSYSPIDSPALKVEPGDEMMASWLLPRRCHCSGPRSCRSPEVIRKFRSHYRSVSRDNSTVGTVSDQPSFQLTCSHLRNRDTPFRHPAASAVGSSPGSTSLTSTAGSACELPCSAPSQHLPDLAELNLLRASPTGRGKCRPSGLVSWTVSPSGPAAFPCASSTAAGYVRLPLQHPRPARTGLPRFAMLRVRTGDRLRLDEPGADGEPCEVQPVAQP